MVQLARGQFSVESLSLKDERKLIAFCRRDVADRMKLIRADVEDGKMRRARRKATSLRGCLAGRILAIWLSLPKEHRGYLSDTSEEASTRRAERWSVVLSHLNAVGDLEVPAVVRLSARPKRSCDHRGRRQFRAISHFGWLDAARQRLIGFSLQPFVDFHPSQHLLLRQGSWGRGRSAVYNALLEKLPELAPGHVFIQCDVRRFYERINHTWLEANLPLPKSVVRAQVHCGGMTLLPVRKNVAARLGFARDGALEEWSRQGVPAGSALSTLVGEFVMAAVLRELSDRLEALGLSQLPELHTYSDNLGLFVQGSVADAVVDLYRDAFANSAAGPFDLTSSPPRPLDEPFKFLGFRFRHNGSAFEAYVPQDVAEHRINAITADILTASPAELLKMQERVDGIAADWSYWDGVADWKADAMIPIQSALLAHVAMQGRANHAGC